MPKATRFPQVDRYLHELDDALAGLPAGERAEIVAAVHEHIEAALTGDDVSADEVERVLRALGDPLAIAAEAEGGRPTPGFDAPSPAILRRGWVPALVIPLAVVSGIGLVLVFPVLTLLIGLALLWMSPLWSAAEKVVGTVLLPAPGLGITVLGLMSFGAGETCEQSATTDLETGVTVESQAVCSGGQSALESILGIGGLLLAVTSGLVTAVVLYRRGVRRAQAPAVIT